MLLTDKWPKDMLVTIGLVYVHECMFKLVTTSWLMRGCVAYIVLLLLPVIFVAKCKGLIVPFMTKINHSMQVILACNTFPVSMGNVVGDITLSEDDKKSDSSGNPYTPVMECRGDHGM